MEQQKKSPFELEEKSFGSDVYKVSTWSVSKALRWQKRISRFSAAPVSAALGGIDLKSVLKDRSFMNTDVDEIFSNFNPTALGTALENSIASLSEDEFIGWMKDIFEGVLKNDKPVNFEADFIGQTNKIYKIAFWILKFQFKDFFQKGSE